MWWCCGKSGLEEGKLWKRDDNMPLSKAHLSIPSLMVQGVHFGAVEPLQMPAITAVSWLWVLDSKWPSHDTTSPEGQHVMIVADAFRSKGICFQPPFVCLWSLSLEGLTPWPGFWFINDLKDMSLPDSQWVTVYNTKCHPSMSLAFSLWELAQSCVQ